MVILALLIGIVAGLRAMTAPAVVSWAAHTGRLAVGGTFLGWMGAWITPWIFTVAAIAELISDQLPKTPSRKVPVQFGTRIVMGAMCGAALCMPSWILGALAGAVGAVIGTLGGASARAKLAAMFGRDQPAALLEDAVAIGAAILIVFI